MEISNSSSVVFREGCLLLMHARCADQAIQEGNVKRFDQVEDLILELKR